MKDERAYHAWLQRPLPPPEDPSVKTLSLPELWGRVRGFLGRVQDEAGGARRLREQGLFGAEDRQEIEGWLKPVERLVRIVLIAQAVIRLLMTPDGRALLRETPKAMPERRRPAAAAAAAESPSSASVQPLREAERGGSTGRCGFRVLKWTPGEEIAASPPALHPRPEPYDEAAQAAEPCDEAARIDGAALQLYPSLVRQMPRPAGRAALALARRIEALSQVIGNPEPAIRRLMRLFARLPHGLIDPAGFGVRFTGNWPHCGPEYQRALMHSERLFTVFNIVTEPG